jgi:uncharacterized membrane protein YtjA (UPF0391 family)
MGTYRISATADQTGFDVEVVDDSCDRQAVIGFKTIADARAWIAEDRQQANSAGPPDAAGRLEAARRRGGVKTTYRISRRDGEAGFEIHVGGGDGVHHTILGFETMADVDAWIAQDKRLTDTAEE